MINYEYLYSVIDAWAAPGEALYLALASALERAIRDGSLPAGTRLPPERGMARDLLLSRGTVEAAYDVLRAKGLVETRRGSGTAVTAGSAVIAPREARVVAAVGGQTVIGGLVEFRDEDVVDFRNALWSGSEELPPDAFALAGQDLDRYRTGHGLFPAGIPELREALAAQLTADGLPTHADELLTISGSQQAFSLFAELLLSSGELAVVESITSGRSTAAFRSRDAEVLEVATGSTGVDVDALLDVVDRRPVRVAHVMPGIHDTTGSMLPGPDARRLAVGMAERESTVLMDDRSLTALWFDRPPPAALAAHEPASPHLITVGSLSRWTWTGLRIGWVRAPKPVIKRIARIKAHEDVGCSIADQVIAVRLLDRAEEIAGARRAVISTRYRRACELLTTHLPDWKWDPPAGGYSMWVRLPRTTTSGELARAARLRGVLIMPGTANAPSGAGTHAFRLSFGVHPDDLERGITRLGEVWAALCEARRGPSAASTPRK